MEDLVQPDLDLQSSMRNLQLIRALKWLFYRASRLQSSIEESERHVQIRTGSSSISYNRP